MKIVQCILVMFLVSCVSTTSSNSSKYDEQVRRVPYGRKGFAKKVKDSSKDWDIGFFDKGKLNGIGSKKRPRYPDRPKSKDTTEEIGFYIDDEKHGLIKIADYSSWKGKTQYYYRVYDKGKYLGYQAYMGKLQNDGKRYYNIYLANPDKYKEGGYPKTKILEISKYEGITQVRLNGKSYQLDRYSYKSSTWPFYNEDKHLSLNHGIYSPQSEFNPLSIRPYFVHNEDHYEAYFEDVDKKQRYGFSVVIPKKKTDLELYTKTSLGVGEEFGYQALNFTAYPQLKESSYTKAVKEQKVVDVNYSVMSLSQIEDILAKYDFGFSEEDINVFKNLYLVTPALTSRLASLIEYIGIHENFFSYAYENAADLKLYKYEKGKKSDLASLSTKCDGYITTATSCDHKGKQHRLDVDTGNLIFDYVGEGKRRFVIPLTGTVKQMAYLDGASSNEKGFIFDGSNGLALGRIKKGKVIGSGEVFSGLYSFKGKFQNGKLSGIVDVDSKLNRYSYKEKFKNGIGTGQITYKEWRGVKYVEKYVYDINGNIDLMRSYVDGLLKGSFKYKNKKRNGKGKCLYENGQYQKIEDCFFQNGIRMDKVAIDRRKMWAAWQKRKEEEEKAKQEALMAKERAEHRRWMRMMDREDRKRRRAARVRRAMYYGTSVNEIRLSQNKVASVKGPEDTSHVKYYIKRIKKTRIHKKSCHHDFDYQKNWDPEMKKWKSHCLSQYGYTEAIKFECGKQVMAKYEDENWKFQKRVSQTPCYQGKSPKVFIKKGNAYQK